MVKDDVNDIVLALQAVRLAMVELGVEPKEIEKSKLWKAVRWFAAASAHVVAVTQHGNAAQIHTHRSQEVAFWREQCKGADQREIFNDAK